MAMSSSAVRGEGSQDIRPPNFSSLEILKFSTSSLISKMQMQNMEIDEYYDYIHDSLKIMITELIAAHNDDGGPVECWIDIPVQIKPKWLPMWIWKRIPTVERRYCMRAEPRWVFPNWAIPTFGTPQKYVEVYRYEE